MTFSQYCDAVENTEQEEKLLQFFEQDKMKQVKKAFLKMARIPIAGKIFAAVSAMDKCESIAAFKRTEHYANIKDMNFAVDFEKNSLTLSPNDAQKKKALKIAAIAGGVLALSLIGIKLLRRKD
ncbi:MAG: hypothetical protein FWE82_06635 [Defluviitaleaceae bacterium]|nr:hypothetical protein [Defluviitaleaceae bacterium]